MQTEPIKTITDLQIEKLNARLDALESENRELKNANQGLWAQLHPVTDTATATLPDVQTTVSNGPSDYDIVVEQLGIH